MLPQRDPSFYIYPQPPPSAQRVGSMSSRLHLGGFRSPASVPLCSSPAFFSLLPLLPLSGRSLGSPGIASFPTLSTAVELRTGSGGSFKAQCSVQITVSTYCRNQHQKCHCPVLRRRGQPLLETDDSISREAVGKGAAKRHSNCPQVTCGIIRRV